GSELRRWNRPSGATFPKKEVIPLALPFFTIGHSTRSLDAFVSLLHLAQVGLLVDVRPVPRSRTNPQYNKDSLPNELWRIQVGYRHCAAMGCLCSRSREAPR